jgi:hypothetical protein
METTVGGFEPHWSLDDKVIALQHKSLLDGIGSMTTLLAKAVSFNKTNWYKFNVKDLSYLWDGMSYHWPSKGKSLEQRVKILNFCGVDWFFGGKYWLCLQKVEKSIYFLYS